MDFINYAHRGASEYAPENTFAAFYLGWQMGANGIETDVQSSKDGVLVLYHDNYNMLRIANRAEAVHDLTYEELIKLDMGGFMGEKYSGERIVTLEEFLRHFSGKKLHFAIEIKEEGVEAKTVSLIQKYCELDHVIITTGIIQSLRRVHEIDANIQLGYLTRVINPELVATLKASGIGQICPLSSALDVNANAYLRNEGFSIRPWGIDSVETMNRMLDLKVDGMTINSPDILKKELDRRAQI